MACVAAVAAAASAPLAAAGCETNWDLVCFYLCLCLCSRKRFRTLQEPAFAYYFGQLAPNSGALLFLLLHVLLLCLLLLLLQPRPGHDMLRWALKAAVEPCCAASLVAAAAVAVAVTSLACCAPALLLLAILCRLRGVPLPIPLE